MSDYACRLFCCLQNLTNDSKFILVLFSILRYNSRRSVIRRPHENQMDHHYPTVTDRNCSRQLLGCRCIQRQQNLPTQYAIRS
ncbi:hypothetical protein IV69_GL000733 [Weissella confusa]|nr:hypothetical protein IV69_GL000733 [Weissella confusa]